MYFTGYVTATALLVGAIAASSETSSASATTSMSTVNLPLVTGMALKASVIHAMGYSGISLSCAAQSKSAMVCSNSIGGGLAAIANIFGGGEKTDSASATSSGGIIFGLPSTTTYNPSEIGKVVVAITAGVEKLASASKTNSGAASTGTVGSTGDNAGLPRATGNAGILAGGAMAAFALAF
ncbi:hypothetical protein KEM54_000122 [Ascosphaera aggregata]|nr:hypothetical protein KEM54_000122 [Ascosphaera aggregata]